jgi:hypothetical protein
MHGQFGCIAAMANEDFHVADSYRVMLVESMNASSLFKPRLLRIPA